MKESTGIDGLYRGAPSLSFGDAIIQCLTVKYAKFSGRASRSEYWYFYLFSWMPTLLFGIITYQSGVDMSAFTMIVGLVLTIPLVSAAVRRMHDVNKSGWYLLLLPAAPLTWFLLLLVLGELGLLRNDSIFFITYVGGMLLSFSAGMYIVYLLTRKGDLHENEYG